MSETNNETINSGTGKKPINKALVAVIAIVIIAVLAGTFALVYHFFKPQPTQGSKSITLTVVDDQKGEKTYDIKTDAQYLREVLENTDGLTVVGSESDYGLYVETVNGVTADYNTDGAYWSFYVNDEYCSNGVDTQPVADKDAFKIVYEVYTE